MTKTSLLISILFYLLSTSSSLSNTLPSTKQADSLFLIGQKKIALQKYRTIITKQETNKPTLLKAIIVAEQNQDIAFQLLCLNKLYKHTHNEVIQQKIETICDEKNINGYVLSDLHWISMWYTLHKTTAILIILGFVLLLCIYYSLLFIKKRTSLQHLLTPLVVILIILLIVNNLNPNFQRSIVDSDALYIRKEKSGISPTVHKLTKGDAVYIHEQNKIWSKISIEEHRGYVRTHLLLNI